MQGEWWHTNEGDNLLKGVEGDEENPIRLPDSYISSFLNLIPEALESFNRLVPQMLLPEQTRLYAIANYNAFQDSQVETDAFQHRLNSQRILTAGPRGGKGR